VAALAASLIVSNSSAQTTALNRLMRQKLEQSQGMLAAVVTSNWADLERRSEALIRITNDPAWMVLNSPEYARQSQAFLRATQDLIDAAKRRDLDAAPPAYVSLTLSCVQCHRYVARARIAAGHARGDVRSPVADAAGARNRRRVSVDAPRISRWHLAQVSHESRVRDLIGLLGRVRLFG
jgi:hypothetical protein